MTYLAELSEIIGACKGCGCIEITRWEMTEEEAQEAVTRHRRLESQKDIALTRWASVGFYCPACIDRLEKADVEGKRQIKIDANKRQAHRVNTFGALQAKKTFGNSNKSLESLQNTDIWEQMRKWNKKNNVWLSGTPGTGKTYLAACVINELLNSGATAAFVSAHELNQIGADFESERPKKLKLFQEARFLMLDDIDKAAWSLRGMDVLWALLNHRNEKNIRTIFTSNISPGILRETWKTTNPQNTTLITSLFDRIKPIEMLEMSGKSLR